MWCSQIPINVCNFLQIHNVWRITNKEVKLPQCKYLWCSFWWGLWLCFFQWTAITCRFCITKRSQQMTKQYTYSRGSHLYVDFWSGVKIFDRQEVCLIAWLSLLTDFLRVKGQNAATHWFLQFRGDLAFDQHWKGVWSLDSILISVANTSTRDI